MLIGDRLPALGVSHHADGQCREKKSLKRLSLELLRRSINGGFGEFKKKRSAHSVALVLRFRRHVGAPTTDVLGLSGRSRRRAPAVARTARRASALDGETVVCGPDGAAIFDAFHRRGTVTEAMLYAFDLLELDGEDLRRLPLLDRKKRLARLLGGCRLGIVLSDHTDEDGATIFRYACRLGLEGIVSKRLTAPYRSGPSRDWLKAKNPNSPAMIRARQGEW
jgi:hypothetical protein